MLLTELVKVENFDRDSIYGVVVDEFCVDLPYKLKEIGLLAQKLNDKELSFDLLDVALALKTNDVEVIIEVPFGFDFAPMNLFYIAMTSGISISVLPPKNGSSEDYLAYKKTLLEYTKLWLSQSNITKMVYPVSGYFQYMFNETLGFKTPEISTDPYMIANYVDNFNLDEMDVIKDEMKETILGIFGGEDKFEEFVHSVGKSLFDKLNKVII